MIYNVDELRRDTVALIKDINAQIDELKRLGENAGADPILLRDQVGNFRMTPLLAAKATAYNTLVMLQTKEPTRSPGRQGRPR